MALNHASIRLIEVVVPWRKLTTYHGTQTDLHPIESDDFPVVGKHIPEDFLVRCQLWSQRYYSNGFFDKSATEDDGRSIENPSLSKIGRAHV